MMYDLAIFVYEYNDEHMLTEHHSYDLLFFWTVLHLVIFSPGQSDQKIVLCGVFFL